MKKGLLGLTLALLMLGSMAGIANAATIQLHFDGVQGAALVDRTVDGTNFYQTEVGLFHFTRTGGTFGPTATEIYTFCIEPREFISPGQTVLYDVVALQSAPTNVPGGMGAAKADLLRELYGVYFQTSTNSITDLTARALQIATWEIVRELSGTYDVFTGNVRYQNYLGGDNALTLANTMLANITNSNNTLRTDIMAAINDGAQDPWIPVPTPEPGTLLLIGLGLFGLAGLRRK